MRKKPFINSTFALSATLFVVLPLIGMTPILALADDTVATAAQQDARHVVTIDAVVVDAGDKDHFQVTADGETFVVLTMGQVKVQKGDHLVLKGAFNANDNFEPDSVDFVDPTTSTNPTTDSTRPAASPARPDAPAANEDHVNFPGIITRNLSKDEVKVRGGNGHIYNVELSEKSDTFQPGDAVRVDGFADGMDIVDALLSPKDDRFPDSQGTFVKDRNEVDDVAPGQAIDISGHIRRLDKRGATATIQGDDHQNYEVSGDGILDWSLRSHVRVQGVLRDGIVQIDRVDLWR